MTQICGVDGCKYGWFALICAENFSNVEWRLARNWTELALTDAVVAVDMPIGLAAAGKRGCDEAARKAPFIHPSSIFAIPVRPALDIDGYAAANAWSKRNGHGGIMKQAWMLRPKLLEIEAAVLDDPAVRIFEAHPELAFARLAAARLPNKKTKEGRAIRLSLLSKAGVTNLAPLLSQFPRKHVAPDDILDAAVLLITAQRILRGDAIAFPDQPRINAQGIEMKIWV